jgi:hypothetical protein
MTQRFADARLAAALLRIHDRAIRRRCTAELVEFSALRAKVEPSFYAALLAKLLANFDADQVALARTMARFNVSVAQVMADDRVPAGADQLGDDHPLVTDLAERMGDMREMFSDVLDAYQDADGCASAMPERGRQIVVRIESTVRNFKRAKVALLTEIRKMRELL